MSANVAQPQALPVVKASDLARDQPTGPSWLIEDLWIKAGVGLIGGPPKSAKSWLALDVGLSTASGTPCLGRFAVARRGPVLLYAAEDSAAIVRSRLESLAAHRRLKLDALDFYVITVPRLRLDTQQDQARLSRTAENIAPAMLILDPFVRLHAADENSAGDVSALLAYLRGLQRQHDMAVVVVHHARKNGSASSPGQALRGSGDFHAWGDVNLYMRRKNNALTLTIEHRTAPSPDPMPLSLVADDPTTVHLALAQTRESDGPHSTTLADEQVQPAILTCLSRVAGAPMTRAALRQELSIRNQRLGEALTRLEDEGKIQRGPEGWACPATGPAP